MEHFYSTESPHHLALPTIEQITCIPSTLLHNSIIPFPYKNRAMCFSYKIVEAGKMESKAGFKKKHACAECIQNAENAHTTDRHRITTPSIRSYTLLLYLIYILYMFCIIILFYYYYTARAFILLPWQSVWVLCVYGSVCVYLSIIICMNKSLYIYTLKSQRSTNYNTYCWDIVLIRVNHFWFDWKLGTHINVWNCLLTRLVELFQFLRGFNYCFFPFTNCSLSIGNNS